MKLLLLVTTLAYILLTAGNFSSAFSPPLHVQCSAKYGMPMATGKDAAVVKETLLVRLGGEPALRAAVDLFYDKLLQQKSLFKFFKGVSMDRLKDHQYDFMAIAFTEIPNDLNVLELIRTKHSRMIDDLGMDENHFDTVAGQFVETLKELKVPQTEIDEAVAVVLPLRAAFMKEEEAP